MGTPEENPYDVMKWFDPQNLDHLRAYKYLTLNGVWPEGWPLGPLSHMWQIVIQSKIAAAWLEEKLAPPIQGPSWGPQHNCGRDRCGHPPDRPLDPFDASRE